jgi:cobalt-zinc-cadmium efflux system membrane fusion protein
MNMNTIKYIIIGFLIISCAGEKVKEDTASADVAGSSPNTVTLTEKQNETIQIEIGKMEQRNLSSEVKANGFLDVPPQNKAVISPMITGYVHKLNFLVGDNVKKGQVMAELESMEFVDLQQRLLELKNQIVYLREDYDRQQLLLDQDAVSKKKFLMAEVEYKTAETARRGLESKLQMLGVNLNELENGKIASVLRLKAPISGSVKKLHSVIGRHVDPSEEIYEIVNAEHLHLELSVYEKDITKIRKGQSVWFTIPNVKHERYAGEVFLVGKDLAEDKRSINVHVHFNENEGAFAVGMYANASIAVSESEVNALPETAIVVDGEKEFVFRKVSSDSESITFEKISVETGIEAGGFVELLATEQLRANDEFVVNGAFYLLNAFSGVENEE